MINNFCDLLLLPDEILDQSFSYLSHKEISIVQIVNKRFKNIVLEFSLINTIEKQANFYSEKNVVSVSSLIIERQRLFDCKELMKITEISQKFPGFFSAFLKAYTHLNNDLKDQIIKCALWDFDEFHTLDCSKPISELCKQLIKDYTEEEKQEIESNPLLYSALFNVTMSEKEIYFYLLEKSMDWNKSSKLDCLLAVKRDGSILEKINYSLKMDKEIVLTAVKQNGLALDFAHTSLKRNREIVWNAVRQNGLALKFADETLKQDKGIVIEAVQRNCYAFQHANRSLRKNKEMVFEVVKKDGCTFHFADKSLKVDKEFVMLLVAEDALAFNYVDETLKKNEDVALAAIKQKARIFQDIDESLKNDKEFVLAALKRNIEVFQYINKSFKTNKGFVAAVVKHNDQVLKYVDDGLKNDVEFVLMVTRLDNIEARKSSIQTSPVVKKEPLNNEGCLLS